MNKEEYEALINQDAIFKKEIVENQIAIMNALISLMKYTRNTHITDEHTKNMLNLYKRVVSSEECVNFNDN